METNHAAYLRQAIQLARRGAGWVQTNPMVGAVLVYRGKVIATGYHAKFGESHAERRLLQTAQKKYPKTVLQQATLYLTLEPCTNKHKKTPPCLPLVLQSGIKNIVIGSVDPNPTERGKSIRVLKRHGITVTVGVMQTECDYLIRTFRKWITTQQPFVLAKTAVSLDGKITAPGKQYLSNAAVLERVHQLRQEFSAIAVGVNTIIQDNPRLTTRLTNRKKRLHQPVKIILDHHLHTPATSRAVDERTIIFCGTNISARAQRRLQQRGASVVPVDTIHEVLQELARRQLPSVLVEGGAGVLTSFINQRAIDEFYFFYTPQIYGETQLAYCGKLVNNVTLSAPTTELFDDNILIRGYANYHTT